MAKWLHNLEQGTQRQPGRNTLRQFANLTLSVGGKTLPENKAQTRYSEDETVDVLLIKTMDKYPDQRHSILTLINDETIILPWNKFRLSKKKWRQLSICLMRQVVRVRINNAPVAMTIDSLSSYGLGNIFYLGHPDAGESLLRVACISPEGMLSAPNGSSIDSKQVLTYRNNLGYCVKKEKTSA